MTDCSLPRVWIIGCSLVARLQAHLGAFGLDQNLGLDCQITWAGRGGRRWEHLMPLLRSKRADIRDDPDVMVIHLGGNSIGTYGNTRISLMRRMKTDIWEINLLFPKTKLMFLDILPRWNWRGQAATTEYGLERTRRRLNGAMFGVLSDMDPALTLLTFEIAINPESGLWSQHSVSHDPAFQLKQRLFVLLSLHDRASEEMNIIQRDLSAARQFYQLELGKIEEALRNPPCAKSLRHEAGVVSALRLKIRECKDQLQQCDIVEQLLVTNSSLVESEVEDLSEEEEKEEEQDEDNKESC
ncbi:hypothetical protein SKAU_G00093500 [Synaphobranchus kaupii]|uniref:SGNH hydrolase-type esterase domain-containing protein n=1 Tax=Synaphobranchus kaupii TaxID=118154 RepID=A0A9Q1FXN7_SYNKA|nr:hypothetical protein SKAU_G00093500 [Synaphobranchus kaupii]